MFTDAERAELSSLYSIAFESFKERVVAYKNATETILNTSSNYNFAYGPNQPNLDISHKIQSGVFYATIQHMNSLTDQTLDVKGESPIFVSSPFVKIGVTGDDRDFLADAKKLVVDGLEFQPATKGRPRGIIDRNYSEYFFVRID